MSLISSRTLRVDRVFTSSFLLGLLAACSPSSRQPEVRLFTWDSYDEPAVFQEFEKIHGIRVVVDRFASNEELLAKLMGGAKGYDVIVPSDYMVSVMVREKFLAPLGRDRVPNLQHIDPRFLDLYYDPGNRYCAPYLWGLSGIGYDAQRVEVPPRGWGVFWDPRYRGQISVMNDQREIFAMALQYLGYPVNTRDPAVLRRAKEKLLEQKPFIKTYNSENSELLLLSGEVAVAHIWSGDINRVSREKPSLRFVLPQEGGFIWQDNLCIPTSSENQEAARKLIDFLLEPRIIARIVERVGFGCPNRAAWGLLPKAMQKNPTIVPQEKWLERLEWIHDVGEAARIYDRLWTELKAG
ncbi:MAG: spermidine/putrescine ABC transporter substrate-binding protein [Elusimicrobia bacterium]|nr:spermidine/putrescine ABC transporter substrate-binding protein [Elusimicrobiota bacterium]